MEPINLNELKVGFQGKLYKALIKYHIKRQKAHQLALSIEGTKRMLTPQILSHLVEFCDRWNSKAYNADFWTEDCAKIFTEIINDASEVLSKANIKHNDEVLFNIFQLITLNFALAASVQPNMRKFAGIKKGLFS